MLFKTEQGYENFASEQLLLVKLFFDKILTD